MKAYLIPLALEVVAIAAPATAETLNPGNLMFEGRVESGTCNLVADDANRTIELPPVKVSDFANTPSAGAETFELTADCDSDIRNVTFTFSGTPSPTDSVRFANTGTANGLGLWLYSLLGGVQQTLRADGLDSARVVTPDSGRAVLPLGAAYWRSGTVSEGTLESLATVKVTYN